MLAARSERPISVMLYFIGGLALVAVPLLAAAFMVSSQPAFLVLCFLAELLVFAGVAPVNSILVLTAPPQMVTFVQGLTVLVLNLFGAFLAPILIGRTADMVGLPIALQLSAISLCGCGVVWLAGGWKARKDAIEP